jgi:hypothetical protein
MGDAEANSSREIRVPVTTIFSVVTFSSSSCAYAAGIAFTATPTTSAMRTALLSLLFCNYSAKLLL